MGNDSVDSLVKLFKQLDCNLAKTARTVDRPLSTVREILRKAGALDPDARLKRAGGQYNSGAPPLVAPKIKVPNLVAFLEIPRTTVELCDFLDCAPIRLPILLAAIPHVKSDGDKYWQEVPEQPAPAVELINDVQEGISKDREQRRQKETEHQLRQKYEGALREVEAKDAALEAALGIADQVHPRTITKKKSSGTKGEATAVAVLSDWHCGAIVKPNTVNFVNEFNPEIFEERAQNYFRNLLTLIKKESVAVNIHNLVLAVIGDLIENSLHPEIIEDQTMSPMQQMLMAQDTVAGGLDYLLKESDLEHIEIPTCIGNHGRTTDKMRAATGYKNSYEQLLYWSLAKHYKNEPRINFNVGDSYVNYTEIYGHTIGWHHGDGTRFVGGVGGLIIPLRKFAYRINQQRKIIVLVNGHWHTQFIDSDVWSNGSLVGATAYGMKLGFAPERPQQIFRLLDADEGFTAYFPILVDKKMR